MALNNSQYDEIFRSYDAKQLKAQHQLEERTKAAYERSPELKALDASIAEISVASARRLLDGDSSALTELKAELKNLRTRKKALMKELSLPENYFEPVYECPDCKDTGYIDGKPCHCFKQQAIDLIYTQSNIKDILARENFSTLSLDYYSDSNINPATGLTSLATAKAAVARCHEFVDQFDTTFANLYFFGDTGIGKTFLNSWFHNETVHNNLNIMLNVLIQLDLF